MIIMGSVGVFLHFKIPVGVSRERVHVLLENILCLMDRLATANGWFTGRIALAAVWSPAMQGWLEAK